MLSFTTTWTIMGKLEMKCTFTKGEHTQMNHKYTYGIWNPLIGNTNALSKCFFLFQWCPTIVGMEETGLSVG